MIDTLLIAERLIENKTKIPTSVEWTLVSAVSSALRDAFNSGHSQGVIDGQRITAKNAECGKVDAV